MYAYSKSGLLGGGSSLYEAQWIRKEGGAGSIHHHINQLGGVDENGKPWFLDEWQAIAELKKAGNERKIHIFVKSPNGERVAVRVKQGLIREYLTTEGDGVYSNNLLSLPNLQ